MSICDKPRCTGCWACVNACPKQCISMENDRGFLYPAIDKKQCVECGVCESVCPEVNCVEKHGGPKAHICYCTDPTVLEKSSSGGMAYVLAQMFISHGGVVFGAAYDNRMHIRHIKVECIEELTHLQGSKYAQSEIGTALRDAKSCLESGKRVLFFGTPCQVAGLLSAIPKRIQDKLYTCDILCGGIPSPVLFEKYIDYLTGKYRIGLSFLNFRSKKFGYSYGYLHEAKFQSGESSLLSGMDASFVKSIGFGYVRESCFACKYVDLKRISDISLGDYSRDARNYKKGISSVLVNSEKGQELFYMASAAIMVKEISISDICESQVGALKKTRSRPKDYDSFVDAIDNCSWQAVYNTFYKPRSLRGKLVEKLPPGCLAIIRKVI